MFERALICTDFKDGLHRLARFVSALAAGGMKQIVFLHAIPVPEQTIPRKDDSHLQSARDRLAAALGEVPAGVSVSLEVQWGKPIETILAAITTYQAEVVIIGNISENLLTERLFGGTATSLCQRSPVPVLIIRPQLLFAFTSEELSLRCRYLFRRLLLPYDGSETAAGLVNTLKPFLQQPQPGTPEHCLLYTVVSDTGRSEVILDNQVQEAEKSLAAAKAALGDGETQITTAVGRGSAVAQTLAAAGEVDATAIAASSKNIGRVIELSVPSFTGDLIRKSWYPVLFFPPSK